MRVEDLHAHATSRYKPISKEDYSLLLSDVLEVRQLKHLSLTVHLPYEIQHPRIYPDKVKGLEFIRFGETLKKFFKINLYWENAPEETVGIWDLKHGQTRWRLVPKDIDLCLDVGHLMMGTKSIPVARARIKTILKQRGSQIKHLHIHENDLIHDQHREIGKVITPPLLKQLTRNRTYIFEKGE